MFLSPFIIHIALASAPLLPAQAIVRLGAPLRGNVQGYTLAFSHDGKFLAEGVFPPAIFVWEVATGKRVDVFSTGQRNIGALGWNGNGQIVAALLKGQANGEVRVFDVATSRAVRTFEVAGGWPLAISPDGNLAVFWHSTYVKNDAVYFVSLWDTATGQQVRDVARPYVARHGRFTEDGKTFVLATWAANTCFGCGIPKPRKSFINANFPAIRGRASRATARS